MNNGLSPTNRCAASAQAFRGQVGSYLHRHQSIVLPYQNLGRGLWDHTY